MKNKLQILTIALVTLIFTNGYSKSTTWNGTAWSNGAPSGTTDVVTVTGGTLTLSANATYNSLILSGGNFNVNGNTFVVTNVTLTSGTFTAAASTSFGGTLTMNGGSYTLGTSSRTLTVVDFIFTSGTFTAPNNLTVTNKLTVNGGTLTTSSRTVTFKDVTLNGGTYTHNANITISGTLTLNGGTYVLGSTARTFSAVNLLVTSGTFSLPSPHTLTSTTSTIFNGGSINLNGNTLNTPTPTFTSGSITSTNVNSDLVITGTHTTSLISNLTRGLITYTNLTVSTNQTLTDTIAITGNLILNGNTFNTAGFLSTIGGNVTVTSASTLQSTGVSRIDATGADLTINGGGLLLNNVELVIDNLTFSSNHYITASNGGFLSFDNSTQHSINGSTGANPGFATNAAHVNAKVRLYTSNGNVNTFYFPIGDGSVYSPFIFDPTSVTGSTAFGQWIEVTYTGAKASQVTLDGSTLKAASGYEYWTVASSATSLVGTVALRYDNNSGKTGKTILSSGSNTANLILAQYNSTSSKWVGIGAAASTTSSITTSTSSASVNPTSMWTIGSNTTGTGFLVALPVTLINFDAVANKSNKTVEVRWATATEENNSHFEIMHSTDFVNWTSIGTVYSKGNSNDMNVYSFTDINPSTVNNYKLKIVALNGEVSYTSIKLVKFTETISATVNVYPNPANANVNLSVDNMDMSTPVTIQLVNPMGQVVFEQIITENVSGMMNTSIPTSEFAAGIYQVTISGTTGTVSQKLIINH